jgi:hypothetical protein
VHACLVFASSLLYLRKRAHFRIATTNWQSCKCIVVNLQICVVLYAISQEDSQSVSCVRLCDYTRVRYIETCPMEVSVVEPRAWFKEDCVLGVGTATAQVQICRTAQNTRSIHNGPPQSFLMNVQMRPEGGQCVAQWCMLSQFAQEHTLRACSDSALVHICNLRCTLSHPVLRPGLSLRAGNTTIRKTLLPRCGMRSTAACKKMPTSRQRHALYPLRRSREICWHPPERHSTKWQHRPPSC